MPRPGSVPRCQVSRRRRIARHTSAANVGIIFAACPALVSLIETLVWKAPLSRRQAGGMFLAILGVLGLIDDVGDNNTQP